MNYIISILIEKFCKFIQFLKNLLEPIFINLDPSHFQNIIIGILAIFIPLAIVFLSDILDSKKNRSEFDKLVLNDEILGTKKLFWISIISLCFFSFFSGETINFTFKVIAIILLIIFIGLFYSPFIKLLKFSEGNKISYEISFLKKLKLSSFIRFKNKEKSIKSIRAWNSFWNRENFDNESDFTKIFISHIEKTIKLGRFNTSIEIANTYLKNIEKRYFFSIGNYIFPKILIWNEKLWEQHQNWVEKKLRKTRIQNFFSIEYFPTFRKFIGIFFSEKETFWNWYYFENKYFPKIIELLIKDENGGFILFTCFKQYIDKCELKFKKIEKKENKSKIEKKYINHYKKLLFLFSKTFFDNIHNSPSGYNIWNDYFPSEWKITTENLISKNKESLIFLSQFLKWSRKRIKKENNNKDGWDSILDEIEHNLFGKKLILVFLLNF